MNGSLPSDSPLEKAEATRRRLLSQPDSQPPDAEDTGQFEVSREGLKVKGVPWWATGIAVVGLVLLAALFVWLKWRR